MWLQFLRLQFLQLHALIHSVFYWFEKGALLQKKPFFTHLYLNSLKQCNSILTLIKQLNTKWTYKSTKPQSDVYDNCPYPEKTVLSFRKNLPWILCPCLKNSVSLIYSVLVNPTATIQLYLLIIIIIIHCKNASPLHSKFSYIF